MKDEIHVIGGIQLKGEIQVSGAKNSALPLLVSTLLTEHPLHLQNIPNVKDIETMIKLLSHHGTQVEYTPVKNEVILLSNDIKDFISPYEIVSKMRASIWALGPLLARFQKATVALPGGCRIGARQVDLHLDVLHHMGAQIHTEDGFINAKSINNKLIGVRYTFDRISVGATINAILAATLAKGESIFYNCAQEPEIIDLCNCLISMGAQISGIGTSCISIIGQKSLNGAKHRIISDRIEIGTYIIAAAITNGDISIQNVQFEYIENILNKFVDTGISIEREGQNLRVRNVHKIIPTYCDTGPYPGFPTDMQAQFMALLSIANGNSFITENIFENRFMHVAELNRMGANIKLEHQTAIINGVKTLNGTSVKASDLRASVALVLAGLKAKGKTIIQKAHHLDRGYENLIEKLSNCGAIIQRI